METCSDNSAFRRDSCSENLTEGDTPSTAARAIDYSREGRYHSTDVDEGDVIAHVANTASEEGVESYSLPAKWSRLLYRRRGMLLATGAAFSFSSENMFKELTTLQLSIFQTGASLGAIVICLTFFCAVVSKIEFPKTRVQYFSLSLSGLCLSVGYTLALGSLEHLEVGDSVTIVYTMPIFAGIFSWIFLREPLRIIDLLFALLSVGGVIVVARPPFIFRGEARLVEGENPLLGALYALGAAVSFALVVVAARKQSFLGLHPIVILLFNNIVVLTTNAVVCTSLRQWQMPAAEVWGYLLGLSFSDFFAQTLSYMAVAVEVAMYVIIISTSEVIMTFIWQFVFFSIVPEWTSAIGAALIIAACVGMATKQGASTEEIAEVGEELSKRKYIAPSISRGVVNDAVSLKD